MPALASKASDGEEYEALALKANDISSGAEDLLERCQALLQEMEDLDVHLKRAERDSIVDFGLFRRSIQSEVKSIEKLWDIPEERAQHAVRSSNLPFYEAVWSSVKRTHSLVAFNKRFYWASSSGPKSTEMRAKKQTARSALVDIVAEGGLEWIKVSTMTPQRLLFEMAKQGWELENNSSHGNQSIHSDPEGSDNSESDNAVTLLKFADDLSKASKATRVRYHHPKIVFVLPRLDEGQSAEIDSVLNSIRATGAAVRTASSLPAPVPLSPSIRGRLIGDDFCNISHTVNIDCTILLVLVSDLSHNSVHMEPCFPSAIERQIEMEKKENLLPAFLYPAMGERGLVCTKEAAERMREIVDLIGTETERRRTSIIMGSKFYHDKCRAQLQAWQDCSSHPVPPCLRFPIAEVDQSTDAILELPRVAQKVAENLTAINKSVFLHGWRSGRTTISSNRVVTKLIECVIEENRTDGDEIGPDIWLCPVARSLVGRKKRGQVDV